MAKSQHAEDSVLWFMNKLTSRIVAQSGIPTDRYHLGKIVLQSLKDDQDFVLQIDGATGASETNKSILDRSIRCAINLRYLGVQQDDVIVLMAPNHLDVAIPLYAALYIGAIIAGIDLPSGINEIKHSIINNKPKVIFCQNDKVSDIREALKGIECIPQIIGFGQTDNCYNFSKFMEMPEEKDDIQNFKCSDFDAENQIALLSETGGTTGLPKSAAITHMNLAISIPYIWSQFDTFPKPTRMALILSPVHWITGNFNYIFSPIFRYTRLQTSQPISKDHVYDIINTYQPSYTLLTPKLLTILITAPDRDRCNLTCFEDILIGGDTASKELIDEIKEIAPRTKTSVVYGLTEVVGVVFINSCPVTTNSLGIIKKYLDFKLVNKETHDDIREPNIPGELWLRGPSVFKGYYNNPEATADSFADGGWFKTGDIFYRDEHWNFYYVERIKLLLEYCNLLISPTEIEQVIRQHPGVVDVTVMGIPDPVYGYLPAACVVPRSDYVVTAQEIKDLVKDSLPESKQLKGGVVFLKELPTTSTYKVNRTELKKLLLDQNKEI